MKYTFQFLLLIIIFIISYNNSILSNITTIKSTYDNRYYKVKNDENKYKKVEVLSKINEKVLQLIHIVYNMNEDNEHIKRLYNTYNQDSLSENLDMDYTAYSLNKGQEISICLIDINGNMITDINTILFVVIHELAHIMTIEVGHPPIFWDNMKYLLKVAVDNNIYKYIDYENEPTYYCGIHVNRTPYKK